MDQDDISDYLPRWQEAPTPFQGDDPQAVPPVQGVPDDVWLDAESPSLPNPPPAFGGGGGGGGSGGGSGGRKKSPTGPTGPTGPAGPRGTRGVRGTMGSQGPPGVKGPPGTQPSGYSGPRGYAGTRGPTGPPGPKGSVIATPFGNVVFSCLEGARPMFFDVLQCRPGEARVALRERFLAAIVPGSARVLSVVPDRRGDVAAQVVDEGLQIEAGGDVGLTVVVAGVNKHFPDWDLPLVSEAARERSQSFWAQEWGGNGSQR